MVIMLSSTVVGPLFYSDNIPVAFAQLSSDDISDIGNYVIYGLEKVDIKENVTIQSGNIAMLNFDKTDLSKPSILFYLQK